IKQSLSCEPYEPVEYGTFGIDQPKPLDMFIIRKMEDSIQIIKNFFTKEDLDIWIMMD
ncbi:6347_t:CDS:1, partial [Gigaspora margarita]